MGQNYDYLKAIGELRGYEFIVPSYQRGYRWARKEVWALLADIYDFMRKHEARDLAEYFYCLQPIVVHELSPKSFNVIDGQQRLTTIFLILKYLDGGGENFFSLDYETREESGEFLRKISQNVGLEDTGNTDFEHFKNAYEVIGEFFEDKAKGDIEGLKREFKGALLESCKVLWYAVGGDEGDGDKVETKVFIRLNTGKIPLTLAENVKALFLLDDGKMHKAELEHRARFWHETEINARRDDDFAYLVLSKIEPKDMMELKEEKRMIIKDDVMRIEAYLRLVCPKDDLFDFYYRAYKNDELGYLYNSLQRCVQGLRSFVVNKDRGEVEREIYHSIGFLVQNGIKPHELYTAWDNAEGKREFALVLNKKVQAAMEESIKNLANLEYTGGKGAQEKLKNILLLFNLEHANRVDKNFEFNRYQLEKWELEHIYPQNSVGIRNAIKEALAEGGEVQYLEGCLMELVGYMDDDRLKRRIRKYSDELNFAGMLKDEALFRQIDDALKAKKGLDSIGNLTLLDRRANSGVGNLVFYKKRLKIDELEGEKRFIPIATKKVFVKDFSNHAGNPFVFTPRDQADYFDAITEALQKFTK